MLGPVLIPVTTTPLPTPLTLTQERITEWEKLRNWRESMALEKCWHIAPEQMKRSYKGETTLLISREIKNFLFIIPHFR